MNDANIIYKTDLGFSFNWKRFDAKHISSINLVISDVAFILNKEDLVNFSNYINIALNRPIDTTCNNKYCNKTILLETPVENITLIKSYKELLIIKELINGTLFELGLSALLKKIL